MTAFLIALNLMILAAGLGVEHLLANRMSGLPEFNAVKIRMWTQPAAYEPDRPTVAAAPVQTGIARLCIGITELTQEHFLELRTMRQTVGMEDQQCEYGFGKKLSWWVFWPPEYEAAQRDQVMKSFRAAGVRDMLPVTQGSMAQSFSLGVFSTEAQARQHRDGLRSRGLDRVEYGPRPGTGSGNLECQPTSAAQYDRLKSGLPAWARVVDADQCAGIGTN